MKLNFNNSLELEDPSWSSLLSDYGLSLGGLPSILQSQLLPYLGLEDTDGATGRAGGCHDPFAIFSFLAFALALFDFLVEAMIIENPFAEARRY